MNVIEFQANIQNGLIEIPPEQQDRLLLQQNGGVVHVILFPLEQVQADPNDKTSPQSKTYHSYIDYLLDNPIELNQPITYLTREEAHQRD